MEMNNMKGDYEDNPTDVYSVIKSPEVRDFLRNEAKLDIFEEEQIILHSYISVRQKIAMLKQLADMGNEEEAGLIKEMHDILAEYMNQIYHPVVRTIFLLENMEPYLETFQKSIFIDENGRLVDVYDTVDEMIKGDLELYSQEGRGMELYGYVSCAVNGLSHSASALNSALSKLCSRNGLPHLTVHGLRHMYATILTEQGVPLMKVSALLGHSSIHTTFEYYCEVMDEQERIISFMNDSFIPEGGKE